MVKIIAFEGTDYSGKTATIAHMAQKFSKRTDLAFNEGAIYPTGLTAKLLTAANQADERDREFLYTMIFLLDASESHIKYPEDDRLVFQDRYWSSVIAYGRFLNKVNSLHNHQDFRPLLITPAATIYLSCSPEEKIKRSQQRNRKSIIDKFLLGDPKEFLRLEEETERSLEGLPNILRIDTTKKPIPDVACEVEDYLRSLLLLKSD